MAVDGRRAVKAERAQGERGEASRLGREGG